MMDLGRRAQLFPDLQARSYWSFAAISPLSAASRRAIDGWHQALARDGAAAFGAAMAAREELRVELAGLLGGDHGDYALSSGTTAGVVALARSLRWRPGGRIVVLGGEFPTNVVPWRQAAADFGLSVEVLPAEDFRELDVGMARLSSISKAGGLQLVACSAVEFQTGLALPLAEIARACHEAGALLAVDAIQAAGVVPLDLAALGVDLAVGGAHKWLLGVDGAGWVYASDRGKEALGPAMAGWLSFVDGARFLFEPGALEVPREHLPQPRVLESGSTSTAAVFALLEGVRACRAARPERSLAWVQGLHDRVEGAVCALGFVSERAQEPARRSGILSFRPPEGVSLRALQAALGRRGVTVTIPDGRLRLAPHFCSEVGEGEALVEALGEALPEARV